MDRKREDGSWEWTAQEENRRILREIRRKEGIAPGRASTVHEKEGVVYLTFPLLESQEWMLHGFSTRLGGVSQGDVGSMNLSFGRESSREPVEENHRRLARAIGYEPEQMVFSWQTHTTNIKVVTEEHRGMGFTRERDYHDVDGLVTNVPGVILVTFYADCVPLLLADPVHRAIGSAHSGWRGTVANMGGAVLRAMEKAYGTKPEEVLAVIGPSICQDCYEVSKDVIEQFQSAYPQRLHTALFYEKPNGKYQLNLWEACRQNFLRAGVPERQISLPDICTCCNPKLLYSHRASQGRRGNLAAVMGIRQ